MPYVKFLYFEAQTGVIRVKRSSSTNFYEYRIPYEHYLKVEDIADRSPEVTQADLVWLEQHDVKET